MVNEGVAKEEEEEEGHQGEQANADIHINRSGHHDQGQRRHGQGKGEQDMHPSTHPIL